MEQAVCTLLTERAQDKQHELSCPSLGCAGSQNNKEKSGNWGSGSTLSARTWRAASRWSHQASALLPTHAPPTSQGKRDTILPSEL